MRLQDRSVLPACGARGLITQESGSGLETVPPENSMSICECMVKNS
jgi:hypothetical protein